MRFSTVAASAAFVGFAAALPGQYAPVVYHTEVVTVTSCPPEKPDCPYRGYSTSIKDPEYHAPTPVVTSTPCDGTKIPEHTKPPVYYSSSTPCTTTPVYTTTPCTTTPVYTAPIYKNTTTPCTTSTENSPKHTYAPPPPHYYNSTTPCTTYAPKTATGYPHPSCPGGDYCVPEHPTNSPAPYPPASTSPGTYTPNSPVYKNSTTYYPPASEGAGSKMGVSIVAIAGAVFFAFLA